MCVSLINSPLFNSITVQASQPGTGFERGASNLILLIKEGASFEDDYKSKGGLRSQLTLFYHPLFKKPCTMKPKKGCRCGNATATPGKLTCCGQRCPCYVDSKPCIECKCRGCRNPHRMDGQKVMPHIPELQQIRLVPTTQQPILGPDIQSVKIEELDLNGQFTAFDSLNLNQHFKTYKLVSGNYNGMPLEADLLPIEFNDEDDDSEITVV
ncbi:hypothetical protein NQ317_013746 [Molorchus minor]|uniref:CXC MSL2-type domain-containing protein n=1 Tax=Molorchus minor TaxID=1323400 RepID=A0ABQ9JE47_9CUCU|nr:hypothetical protein NQ317_013746 [Molorchus minor]